MSEVMRIECATAAMLKDGPIEAVTMSEMANAAMTRARSSGVISLGSHGPGCERRMRMASSTRSRPCSTAADTEPAFRIVVVLHGMSVP